MGDLIEKLLRKLENGTAAELVSVVEASGSTPRGAGALLAAPGKRHRKASYGLTLALNIAMLGYFKYTGFLVTNLNALGASLTVPSIALPAGISFFTFQAIAYLTDVYRGAIPAERSLGRVTLFMAFFPQLLQGPILRYDSFAPALTDRRETAADAAEGAVRFCFGLGKKVLLADALGQIANGAFSAGDRLTVSLAWLGAIAYTLQLYFDFSGKEKPNTRPRPMAISV